MRDLPHFRFAGFLSYARIDDEHDGFLITEIRRRLENEVRRKTASEFPIFQDRDDIGAGQPWQSRIDRSIDATTFLIVFVAPSFMASDACRAETLRFMERESQLGRDDLIIPILYMDTPALRSEDDPIARELSSRQYFTWGDLRFEDPDSPQTRRAVAHLADQLQAAIERSALEPDVPRSSLATTVDDELGDLELQAESEEAIEQLAVTMAEFTDEMKLVGEVTEEAAANVTSAQQRSSRPAAAQLVAVKQFADRLSSPAGRMDELADSYSQQIAQINRGISATCRRLQEHPTAENTESGKRLLESVCILNEQSSSAFESLHGFRATLRQNLQISSTLRPVLGQLSSAVQKVTASEEVFGSWETALREALGEHPDQAT